MTYLPTGEGWLSLAVVLELCSRAVVGWAMANHRRAEFVHRALAMALCQRRPAAGPAALYAPQASPWLRDIPAVETLRRVWVQPLYLVAGQVHWRTEKEGIPPAGLFLSSPYDVEARYAKKQTTSWIG